uniref:Cytochrome p450 CYP4EC3 n=1 Tax=Brachionus calyciflorus TaxID=104777 RepID=A0A2H4PSJ2_9BILA|nr:cytochrome p450 CYP4EC3 [Brachionus calyciflorus]
MIQHFFPFYSIQNFTFQTIYFSNNKKILSSLTMNLVFDTIVYLIVITILFKIIKWLVSYYQIYQRKKNIKHLPMLPFIGNIHLMKPRKELFNQLIEIPKYFPNEPFFCNWIGTYPVVIVHNSSVIEEFFNSSKHTEKVWLYSFVEDWLGTGLLTSFGEKWHRRRRLLTPAFHFEILENFREIMNEHSEILVQKFEKFSHEKKPIEIFKELKLCTLDIIGETAMGVNLEAQKNLNVEYVKSVDRASYLLNVRFNSPWEWNDFIYYNLTPNGRQLKNCLNILHSFTRDVILKRDAEFDETDFEIKKKFAFLDILLKAKRQDPTLTFQDIQEEVDTFMFEGHDTTAVSLAWTLLLLAENKDIQEKVQQEIDENLAHTNKHLTSDDLKKLKYLECVIKESLRLYPSAPFIGRSITEDCEIAGHKFKRNDPVLIAICAIHRDEKFFPDPERFDPDRFLNENLFSNHPYCYIPFSAGRRNCIGQKFAQMELKIVLIHLLRKFNISSMTRLENVIKVSELTLHALDDVEVYFETRFS